ncbi:MAG TPA: PDZ domain-containing protein [Acidimicrobiia bacterium]
MRRVAVILVVVLVGCVAQPPERSPLPDVAEVLPEVVGCQLNVGSPLGVNVESVLVGGPANGILEEDDVITAISGEPTPDRPTLSEIMADYGPGETITVAFTRDGSPDEALVTLTASSADPDRGVIGITVQTAFDHIAPDEADATVTPTTTTRPIQIAGSLFILDPLTNSWQETGIVPPEDTRWVSTSTGLYSVTGTEDVSVLDLFTEEPVEDDGFQDWDAQRLIGSVDDLVLVVVTTDIPEQPGFVNLAIAGFDPRTGETAWVTEVTSEAGIPVAAYGSPDGSAFVSVGADPDSGDLVAVTLYDATGAPQNSDGLSTLGDPMGWFDNTSLSFRTSESEISVFSFIDGSTEVFDLPESAFGSVTAAVGDGQHILVLGGRDLLLQDLTDPNFNSPLADNCTIGRAGDPGWGV